MARRKFIWDEEKKKWVEVDPVNKRKLSWYGMPLEKYCERKGNCGKGSWPRNVDPNGEDFGKFGCKNGKGYWHPMMNGRCKYCDRTKEELEQFRKDIEEGWDE